MRVPEEGPLVGATKIDSSSHATRAWETNRLGRTTVDDSAVATEGGCFAVWAEPRMAGACWEGKQISPSGLRSGVSADLVNFGGHRNLPSSHTVQWSLVSVREPGFDGAQGTGRIRDYRVPTHDAG